MNDSNGKASRLSKHASAEENNMTAIDAEYWSKSQRVAASKSSLVESLIDALMPTGVLNTLASTSNHKYDS